MLTVSQGKNKRAAIVPLISVLCGCLLAFIQCGDSPTGMVPSSMTDPDSAFEIRIVHDEASSLGWREFVDVTIDHLPHGFLTFFLAIEVDWSLADSLRLIPGEIFGDDQEALVYEIDNVSHEGMAVVTVQPSASRMSLGDRSDLLPYGINHEGPVVLFTLAISPRSEILNEWRWHPIRFTAFCYGNELIYIPPGDSGRPIHGHPRHVFRADGPPPSPLYLVSEIHRTYLDGDGQVRRCEWLDPNDRLCVDFYDGGVLTADEKDFNDGIRIGDVDQNGQGPDVADAVFYISTLSRGASFMNDYSPERAAASDVNRDGRAFTPADLAYLLNIMASDSPCGTSHLETDTVDYTFANGIVRIHEAVAEVYAVYAGEVELWDLVRADAARFDGDSTRLWYAHCTKCPAEYSGALFAAPRPPDRLEFSSPQGAHIVARRIWD
ncbi:MAG: hypothetical protein ABIE70_03830 [bacterium]